MHPIHSSTVAFIISLSTVWVSPKLHVAFDNLFTTVNVSDVNLVPTRYCHAMCRFIKGNKSVFIHSEQHDISTTLISPPDQGRTTSDNVL